MSTPDVVEGRLAAGARLFALVALTVPVVLASNVVALVGLIILALIWMTGLVFRSVRVVPGLVVITFEAIAVGVTLGAALDNAAPLLGALAVAPLLAGIRSGARGVLQALAAEAIAFAFTAYRLGAAPNSEISGGAATWLVAGLGFGLVAGFVRGWRIDERDDLTPYRDARALISQLLDLSGELREGLDPVSISQRVIDLAQEDVPFVGGVVYVRRGSELTPLVDSAEHAGLDTSDREDLVNQVWSSGMPMSSAIEVAFPLRTDAGVVAVVAGGLPATVRAERAQIGRELELLSKRFKAEALQLDTALLFAAVRDEATSEERRRLAREVHDGVAQDVASLGYLVDDLEDSAVTEDQAQVFRQLRSEITSVVAELRRSVFSLRNEASSAGSLGESVGALARHVTTVTGIPVHVALDEGTTRLRSEIESELLRIAQEGMNNAVRHAHAHNIWVEVTVAAPNARVIVRDDGQGIGDMRHDSHGVRIMNERAALIGARLDLSNAPEGGTVLRVEIERTSSETTAKGSVTS